MYRTSPGVRIAFIWVVFALTVSAPGLNVSALAEDPWPFWGRTPTRLGRTATVGPRTPRIEWSILFSTRLGNEIRESSPVMDDGGRIFVETGRGMTAINSAGREVLWNEEPGDATQGAAVWEGRVLWGDAAPFSTLYCYDAATGEELWTFEADRSLFLAPVVSPDGVVYKSNGGAGLVHARSIVDGGEVWTRQIGSFIANAPSLDWASLLTSGGGRDGFDLIGLDPLTGEDLWTFETNRWIYGISPVFGERVYFGGWDRYLHCLDVETGQEIWAFWCEQINRGSVAIGHDGTIYTATTGNVGILFALSPDGDEIWRRDLPGLVSNAPIVGGDGTVYLCSSHWTGSEYEGRVHAIRPDGSELWAKLMPDDARASPMLAPDGTLYVVCRDKFLYAFRDPAGDLDFDGDIDLNDFARFEGCLTGPRLWGEAAKTAPGCELLDFDSDWDVDLTDLGQFQLAFTGPK